MNLPTSAGGQLASRLCPEGTEPGKNWRMVGARDVLGPQQRGRSNTCKIFHASHLVDASAGRDDTVSKLVLESAASLENAQEICSISLTPCFSGVWAKNEVLSTVSTVYNPITECVRSRNVKKTVENGSRGQSVRVTQLKLKLGVNESSHARRRKLLRLSRDVPRSATSGQAPFLLMPRNPPQ
jgi:hypothetical protein